jgi:hypothetical protein
MKQFNIPTLMLAVLSACLSLAPAFAMSEHGGSGIEQMPHYSLQHHDAPAPTQMHSTPYNQPSYVPNYQAPQAYAPSNNYSYGTPSPATTQYAPEAMYYDENTMPAPERVPYGTKPDGMPDTQFSRKVDTWKNQYAMQNPAYQTPNPSTMGQATPEPGRFAAVSTTKPLKLEDSQAMKPLGVGHKRRPSSMFTPVKEMTPFSISGRSIYLE